MVRDIKGKERVRVLYLGESRDCLRLALEASSLLLKGSDHRGFGRSVAKHHESPLGKCLKQADS